MDNSILKQLIDEQGEYITTFSGTSMWPLLRHRRDSVHLEKYDGTVKKNDIVLYIRTTGEHVLHRCIDIENDTYTMCGDNQTAREHGITDSQIVAVAKGIYRDEKYIPKTNLLYSLWVWLWCLSLRVRGKILGLLRHTKAWKNINNQVLNENKLKGNIK